MYEITKLSQDDINKLSGLDRRGNPKYPFAEMEIGDQFEVPLSGGARVKSAARAHAARHQRRFVFKRSATTMRVIRLA